MTGRLLPALALAACTPSPDLERMLEQPRGDPYEPSRVFSDGRTMRPPVPGTVPRSRVMGTSALTAGVDADGSFVEQAPLAVTRAVLDRGRDRYDVFCAPCHGLLGDGQSDVAENMALRKPTNLQDGAVRGYPDGRLYSAVTHGYGLMPAYAAYLDVEERWAIAAYVRALQLSQGLSIHELPAELRREAGSALQ